MAKLKVQAQHLQPGDIVGSGEVVQKVIRDSIHWPTNKACIYLWNPKNDTDKSTLWGKYTLINVERAEKVLNK